MYYIYFFLYIFFNLKAACFILVNEAHCFVQYFVILKMEKKNGASLPLASTQLTCLSFCV